MAKFRKIKKDKSKPNVEVAVIKKGLRTTNSKKAMSKQANIGKRRKRTVDSLFLAWNQY
jgi:hypothetical protein